MRQHTGGSVCELDAQVFTSSLTPNRNSILQPEGQDEAYIAQITESITCGRHEQTTGDLWYWYWSHQGRVLFPWDCSIKLCWKDVQTSHTVNLSLMPIQILKSLFVQYMYQLLEWHSWIVKSGPPNWTDKDVFSSGVTAWLQQQYDSPHAASLEIPLRFASFHWRLGWQVSRSRRALRVIRVILASLWCFFFGFALWVLELWMQEIPSFLRSVELPNLLGRPVMRADGIGTGQALGLVTLAVSVLMDGFWRQLQVRCGKFQGRWPHDRRWSQCCKVPP